MLQTGMMIIIWVMMMCLMGPFPGNILCTPLSINNPIVCCCYNLGYFLSLLTNKFLWKRCAPKKHLSKHQLNMN